jgi:alpha-tubulin suppressor-like RCC1 family protein
VTLGDRHGCILTKDADVECWGDNSNGQLGWDPTQLSASETTRTVPGLSGVTAVAAGSLHTCAVSQRRIYCWGNNERLQLGRTTDTTHPGYLPTAIDGLTDVTSVAAGSLHSCALGADKKLRCWGANDKGQLANPDKRDALRPVTVPLDDVRSVSLGKLFSCAVTAGSKAYCWGDNTWGQLGTGQSNSSPSLVPTPVRALSGSTP